MGTFIICGSFTASAGSENRIVLFQHLYKCVQQRPSDSFPAVHPWVPLQLFYLLLLPFYYFIILFFLFERVPPGNSRICGFLSLIHKNRTQHITTIVSSSLSFIFYLFLSRIRCSRSSSSSPKEKVFNFFFLLIPEHANFADAHHPAHGEMPNHKKKYMNILLYPFLFFFFFCCCCFEKEGKKKKKKNRRKYEK